MSRFRLLTSNYDATEWLPERIAFQINLCFKRRVIVFVLVFEFTKRREDIFFLDVCKAWCFFFPAKNSGWASDAPKNCANNLLAERLGRGNEIRHQRWRTLQIRRSKEFCVLTRYVYSHLFLSIVVQPLIVIWESNWVNWTLFVVGCSSTRWRNYPPFTDSTKQSIPIFWGIVFS